MLNKTLSPQVATVIDIQLNNPLDTATYYVQSVVSDKVSGATLYTVKLVNKGNQYFSAPWTSPQDPTGFGRELLVATTVYTDAGYSQVSPSYGSSYDTWIIRSATQFYGGGGGQGGGIDYDKIKALIKECMDEEPDAEFPKTDMGPIQSLLEKIDAQTTDDDEGAEDTDRQKFLGDIKEMLGSHAAGISAMLGDHAMKMQQIMGSLFAHHTDVLDEMRGLLGKTDEAVNGGNEARAAHLQAISTMLDKHKADIGEAMDAHLSGIESRPVMLDVSHFLKAPNATQPEKKKNALQRLLS